MQREELVRDLCENVARERDAGKTTELLHSLRDLVSLETDEARLRIRQILLHYRDQYLGQAGLRTAKPQNSISRFLAALIASTRQQPSDRN